MSELPLSSGSGLKINPCLSLELIQVQPFVTKDIGSSLVGGYPLSSQSSTISSRISEWVRSWCISISVLKHELKEILLWLSLSLHDKNRFGVLLIADKSLGLTVVEELTLIGVLVSLLIKPARLELELGFVIEFSWVAQICAIMFSFFRDKENLACWSIVWWKDHSPLST